MVNRQPDKWVLKTYGEDVTQLYHTLYSVSGHPVEQTRRIVLVEGTDDKKFYGQFAKVGVPIFFATHGCDNMNALVDLLHRDKTPFLAIQDSDFYRLDGVKKKMQDLYYTDKHDWEMTALGDFRTLISFMSKFCIHYRAAKKVLVDSFKDLEYLSYYKWYNVRNKCRNDFEAINASVLTASSAELGDYSYLTKLIPDYWRGSRKVVIQQAVLRNYILTYKTKGIEFQLVTGHHLLDRFIFYLTTMGRIYSSKSISKELMKSVTIDEFKKTNLYKEIKQWEAKNIAVFC